MADLPLAEDRSETSLDSPPVKKERKNKNKAATLPANHKVLAAAPEPLFGASLEDAAIRSDTLFAVPSPIRTAVEYLNKKGLNEEGLYRVPGNASVFQTYKAMYDSGADVNFEELDERSPENVAMIVIKYLQMLPEPLVTKKYEQHFKLAIAIENKDESYAVIRAILARIPHANRETIKILAEHLKLVCNNAEKNKMSASNIAITWSLSVGPVVGALMKVLVEWNQTFPSTVVFGVPITDALANSETPETPGPFTVPSPIARCTAWLDKAKNVTDKAWLKTLKPTAKSLQDWRIKFDSGIIGPELPADMEAKIVIGLIKMWVADLPGGLFGKVQRYALVKACMSLRGVALVTRLKDMIWEMSELLREVVRTLVFVLQEAIRANPTTLNAESLGSAIFGKTYRTVFPPLIAFADVLFMPGNVPIDLETLQTITPACAVKYLAEPEAGSVAKTPDGKKKKKKRPKDGASSTSKAKVVE